MKLLRAEDHRRMPWKNGGGETLEVAVSPAGAGVDDFAWRVSMAIVASDGPFSLFPGIDRTLVLLDGDGMRLDIAGPGAVTLVPGSAPHAFPADVATGATLVGGAITDLNVMTARGRCTHAVARLDEAGEVRAEADGVLLLLGEGMTIEAGEERFALAARDVLLLEAGDAARVAPGERGGWRIAIAPAG